MTLVELLVPAFLRAELAASLGVVVVAALRIPARRLFGAELAYKLWFLPIVCAFASFFPTLREFIEGTPIAGMIGSVGGRVDWAPSVRWSGVIAAAWAAGAGAALTGMALAEKRFRRLIRSGRAGPAVAGVAWPRMVVPDDYATRFTPHERALIRAHERVHMARQDPMANLWIAAFLAAGWFNPLAHLAADLARLDQELACDAAVIAVHPGDRRAYAQALVKAQLLASPSPLACLWGAHPLELRIRQLSRRRVSLARYMAGAVAVGGLCVALAVALWGWAPI